MRLNRRTTESDPDYSPGYSGFVKGMGQAVEAARPDDVGGAAGQRRRDDDGGGPGSPPASARA